MLLFELAMLNLHLLAFYLVLNNAEIHMGELLFKFYIINNCGLMVGAGRRYRGEIVTKFAAAHMIMLTFVILRVSTV
jgi:hypothetical protein